MFLFPLQRETRHIDLTLYGEANRFTAMARTVGWPTAIAAKMILNGKSHNYVCNKINVVEATTLVAVSSCKKSRNTNIILYKEWGSLCSPTPCL